MMKGTDKFLVGITAGIVLLLVVTFTFVLTRPEGDYVAEGLPDGVVHNYLLALQKGEHERAFEYLSSDLNHGPNDVEEFIDHIDHFYFINLEEETSKIIKTDRVSDTHAEVTVYEIIYSNNGIFSGQYERNFDMKLHLEEGKWKIIDGDSYWRKCWSSSGRSGCKY
jgi:hypothetical protein